MEKVNPLYCASYGNWVNTSKTTEKKAFSVQMVQKKTILNNLFLSSNHQLLHCTQCKVKASKQAPIRHLKHRISSPNIRKEAIRLNKCSDFFCCMKPDFMKIFYRKKIFLWFECLIFTCAIRLHSIFVVLPKLNHGFYLRAKKIIKY